MSQRTTMVYRIWNMYDGTDTYIGSLKDARRTAKKECKSQSAMVSLYRLEIVKPTNKQHVLNLLNQESYVVESTHIFDYVYDVDNDQALEAPIKKEAGLVSPGYPFKSVNQ